MISLRRYLYPGDSAPAPCDALGEQHCQALAGLASALLDGIETSVVHQPHPRLRVFSEELGRLRRGLEEDSSPGALQEAGPGVAALLERHRLAVQELREREGEEVAQIISMLNQTVAALSRGSERSVARLRQVESDLKLAVAVPDIVALKARLSDTLAYVREQSSREKEESAREVAALEREALRAAERIALARSGLPGRTELELHLVKMLSRPVRGVLAGFVLDRAAAIRQRFGDAAGERYVFLFVQDLLALLPAPAKLFRWNASVLMADLETAAAPDAVRAELNMALAALPPERRLDIGQRVAVFSNQHRWVVIPLAGLATPADVVGRIEPMVRT